MNRIPFVDIKDFKCNNCYCKGYSVISLNPLSVVCSNCGEEITPQQYKNIVINHIEEKR